MRFLNHTSKIIVGCFLACSTSNAMSANWKHITTSNTGTIVFVDESSINRSEVPYTAWFKEDASKNNTVQYDERKSLIGFNCVKHKMDLISFANYRKDGSVISSGNYKYSTYSEENIIPDTVGEDEFNYVCENGK